MDEDKAAATAAGVNFMWAWGGVMIKRKKAPALVEEWQKESTDQMAVPDWVLGAMLIHDEIAWRLLHMGKIGVRWGVQVYDDGSVEKWWEPMKFLTDCLAIGKEGEREK